ncbi:Superoxide-generating NADPH oxidase heavy chain subunit B [Frankliniella fusca]|uniref:Superoxide-generating NADPH oxidase heavy chain subunit B n=1 Tax=Frankliniella fusca TaxID=407009 RepID=A0AAE1GPC1_9NEOP|nr:Superoxide-generating NADPH oxidase heavy chain subunit B [Frankliniella fusca]
MEGKKRKRSEYKRYWSRDGPQKIPRSTKHSRKSSSSKHFAQKTEPLQESSSDLDEHFDEDSTDMPVVSVLMNSYREKEAAHTSEPEMIVNDLPSDVEPHIETECDHNDHTSGEPDMDNSFSEENNLLSVGLCDGDDDQSKPPANDTSFDDEFCCNFNVDDDGCVSEEETARLLSENAMTVNSANGESSTHSSPARTCDSSPQSDNESSSDSDDEMAIAPQLHLTIQEKIKILLLLATKKRHNLSYSAAENIIDLANVLSHKDENTAFHPTKHIMKRAIELYSFALSEHHVCPDCGVYIGVVGTLSFYCAKCDKTFVTLNNRSDGNMFLYLPMEDQLRALLENCLSEETIIDTRSRKKINQHNYEDLFDGAFYKKYVSAEFLTLNFFIDGVQIGTTTKTSAWPILDSLNELPLHLRRKYLMMASVWLSKKKPKCNEYLKPFVQECSKLQTEGVHYKRNGKNLVQKFKVCVCVSDSVARPLLRNCNQFNGKCGCGLCYHPGIRMAFGRGFIRSYSTHERIYPLRTHEETMFYARQAEQTAVKHIKGIKGQAILSDIPGFDIVKQLDPDSFHCLVNVGKRFAWLWFDEKFHNEPFNISRRLSEVDTRLLKITPTSDVSRFRSLTERSDYRGHEWYHWIMIYSIPCLKKILPNKYLNHWSKLSYALALLMQNSVAKSEVVYANRYLNSFVSEIDNLYGAQHVTFSVHLLTHLTQSVEDFGQPWCHSAFIYEAVNAEIKDLVKSSNGAIFQITKGIQLKVALKNVRIFILDSFIVPDSSDMCFALGRFIMEKKQQKLCDTLPPHLKVLKNNPEGTLRSIPISDIVSKLLSFSVNVSETETFRLAFVNVLSMEFLK